MTLDMGNTDKLAEFRAEARAARHQGRAAVGQPLRRSISTSRATRSSTRSPRSRASAGRRSRRSSPRAASGRSPISPTSPRRINPRAVNKRVLESLAAAGAFDAFETNRARVFAAVDAVLGRAQRAHETAAVGQSELFGGGAAREHDRAAAGRALAAGRAAAAANTRRSASSCPAIRSTTTPPC